MYGPIREVTAVNVYVSLLPSDVSLVIPTYKTALRKSEFWSCGTGVSGLGRCRPWQVCSFAAVTNWQDKACLACSE